MTSTQKFNFLQDQLPVVFSYIYLNLTSPRDSLKSFKLVFTRQKVPVAFCLCAGWELGM